MQVHQIQMRNLADKSVKYNAGLEVVVRDVFAVFPAELLLALERLDLFRRQLLNTL
jgi:hypothetical protein